MSGHRIEAVGGSKKIETIETLIQDCNESIMKMSPSNPNRLLLHNCTLALRQLCDRLYALEKPKEPTLVTDPLDRVNLSLVEKVDEILGTKGGKA